MPRKKEELPGLDTWLKCPMCTRRDYRYRARQKDYLCKVCGTRFHVNFVKKLVWQSVAKGAQPNV